MRPRSRELSRRRVHAAVIVMVEKAARTGGLISADRAAESLLRAFPDCGMSEREICDEIAGRATKRLVALELG